MDYAQLILVALAPVIAIIIIIYFADRYEKEPIPHLIRCFVLGMLSVIPAIALETLGGKLGLGISENMYITLVYAFLVVGFSEELSKYLFLRYYAYKHREFNEPFDGIVYAVMISLGFAAVENVMYVLQGGMSVALSRAFTAVPMHAAFAVIMGFWVGAARFTTKNKSFLYLARGLFYAVFVHGFYDFVLMQSTLPVFTAYVIVIIGVALYISYRAVRIHQINSPFRKN